MKYYLLAIILLLGWSPMMAQHEDHDDHHGHVHSQNEIGLSGGPVYCFDHNEWGGGIHLHYFRTLKPHGKWALGLNLEQVWTDEGHFTLGVGAKYQFLDDLSLAVMPGITFYSHKEHGENASAFSTHFELVYDLFHWENFHLGPVVDYSWAKDDSHSMIGIHAACCF